MRIFNIIRNKIFLLTAFSYLIVANVVVGEGLNPTEIRSIPALLTAILEFVVDVGKYVVPLAIIYAGFKFIEAKGNPEKIETARRTLFWILIGGAIILGAQVLKTVIIGTVEGIQGR